MMIKVNFKKYLMDHYSFHMKTSLCWGMNGVITPALDRSSTKGIKHPQGKLPKTFFEMMNNLTLIDSWSIKMALPENIPFFQKHKSFSRIDIIRTKNLANKILKVDILSKSFSDHNSVLLVLCF